MYPSERAREVIDSYHQRLNAASVKGHHEGRYYKCPECPASLRTKRGRNSHYTQLHAKDHVPQPQKPPPPLPDYAALRQAPMRALPKLGYPKPLQPEAMREYKSPSILEPDVTLKSCTRCGGDMVYGYDQYGADVHCLQCGHRI